MVQVTRSTLVILLETNRFSDTRVHITDRVVNSKASSVMLFVIIISNLTVTLQWEFNDRQLERISLQTARDQPFFFPGSIGSLGPVALSIPTFLCLRDKIEKIRGVSMTSRVPYTVQCPKASHFHCRTEWMGCTPIRVPFTPKRIRSMTCMDLVTISRISHAVSFFLTC